MIKSGLKSYWNNKKVWVASETLKVHKVDDGWTVRYRIELGSIDTLAKMVSSLIAEGKIKSVSCGKLTFKNKKNAACSVQCK